MLVPATVHTDNDASRDTMDGKLMGGSGDLGSDPFHTAARPGFEPPAS